MLDAERLSQEKITAHTRDDKKYGHSDRKGNIQFESRQYEHPEHKAADVQKKAKYEAIVQDNKSQVLQRQRASR